MKRNTIFFSISLLVIFSMVAGFTASTAQPEVDLGKPGLSYRYTDTLGETGVPYLEDSDHLNYPWGIGSDGTNIWIGEGWSSRALKFASDGTFLMQIGTASFRAQQNIFQVTDVGVDASGNVWLVDSPANHILEYDPSGNQIGELGQMWDCSSANDRFCNPRGIAFDASGNIYVPDSGNARIQILDGNGQYLATLGTGVPGPGNDQFYEPEHIAIYADQLYVADSMNQRIQIFDITSPISPTYVATIGETGVPGDDNDHFACPNGVSFDTTYIYIADACNNRIQIFDRATRIYFATVGTGEGQGDYEFVLPTDVVVDSAGNLYVADYNNLRVQQFDPAWAYVRTYGTTGVPYLTDAYHYNIPLVSTDAEDNILITEEWGHRLVKLDPDGNFLWSFGVPGVAGGDNDHLSSPSRVAADSSGNIYVPDRWSCRVQIITSAGVYSDTIGTGCGTGDYEFSSPAGVAIGSNGLLYVADSDNQRVQIFDISTPITPTYVATIGETGVCAADNDHFCRPSSVELDSAGNIYVADSDNHRIQKFDSNRVWQMTIGTGIQGYQFDQLASPEDVTVDAQGKIFVSDAWNNRVQVFDSTGAYLTTIGTFGTNSSQFNVASSTAVNGTGGLFVSDQANSRIQIFAPGVPGWIQMNINGFGDPDTIGVTALENFNGQLYAGASNWVDGGQVWSTSDGSTWMPVSEPGFTDTMTTTNRAIIDLVEFKGQLYASTGWGGFPGQIWRTSAGTDWQPVVEDGFGNPDNSSIGNFTVLSDTLYAAAGNVIEGFEIWRSPTGDSLSWTPVITAGLGYTANQQVTGFTLFDGFLYIAIEGPQPCQVWRSADGSIWDPIITDGFGDPNNSSSMGGWATLDGYLYIGTRNEVTGAQLWRSNNGTAWEEVIDDGFGDLDNIKIELLFTFEGNLFAGTQNNVTGMQVWRSPDGSSWTQVNPDGFGDSNNTATLWSNATIAFHGRMVIGTWNYANGGEVWALLNHMYLPVINR
jgi:streptogramin lyase